MSGRLYIVGTPIGNLGDITLRAVETLRLATRIYAEDTRRTRTLLTHLGIEGKKLISMHAHSSDRAIATAIEMLSEGESLALVTDAGMPSVSDPGADLASAAREAGHLVTVVPGPSAVTSAVALSGLVDGPFSFFGFLPRKGTKRAQALRTLTESPIPVVLFESPHRINETLVDLRQYGGDDRRVCICRELTKKFEETLVGRLGELGAAGYRDEWLGELTIVLERGKPIVRPEFDVTDHAVRLLSQGASVKDVTSALVKELTQRGQKPKKRELYQQVLSLASESEG